jgi:hypothetical protein
MANPFPEMTVDFETRAYEVKTTDIQNQNIKVFSGSKDVTNYEYELQKNNDKRQILVLKPEYLGAFIVDMRNIMKYDKSSQTIDDKTKRVYNPKLKGV